MGIRVRVRQGHSRRGSQVTGSRVHTKSILPQLVGQHSDGQKGQQKVEDICGLHGLKQGMPQGQLPTSGIDILVDSIARHQLLSFTDAFSGYN